MEKTVLTKQTLCGVLACALSLGVAQAQHRQTQAEKTAKADSALYSAASHGDKAAIQKLTALANKRDEFAQYYVGAMYGAGQGVPRDLAQAAIWLRRSADQGVAQAQNYLGAMYGAGDGVPKDLAQASAWYRKAADQGYPAAQVNLGMLYYSGQPMSKDDVLAASWFRKAADQVTARAQYNVEVTDVNLADRGVGWAQFYLGGMYARGEGVLKDPAQAVDWYGKAAVAGLAEAQSELGLMYYSGQGGQKSSMLAAQWIKKAADQGVAKAQFSLGVFYEDGEGVAKDARLAGQWYRKAADQGYASAQNNLGGLYYDGRGVPKDASLAAQWYQRAADQGLADAQHNLGRLYEKGEGVSKDARLAGQWYRRAADQGDSDARKDLERLTRAQQQAGPSAFEIVLQKQNGVLVVPVLINNKIPLDFILDSGAADVSVPADVVLTLMRTGTLTEADFTGTNMYVLADGSKVPSQTFRIRSLKVGDRVLENVSGSVSPVEGSLLLGQSFLSRFKSWSIDNTRQVLVLQ